MNKMSEMGHSEKTPLVRLLLNLPAVLFLLSLSRGIWHYRLLPDMVPPLLPVLWPFSLPLPRFFYILMPLGAVVILVGSRVWARDKGRNHPHRRGEAGSGETESWRAGHGSVERLRKLVSRPAATSFLLQIIVVTLYSYIQERLLTDLTGGLGFPSHLTRFYGLVLALSLMVFLFTLMIRMYRKDNTPD